jgi:general secretion pathway protein A
MYKEFYGFSEYPFNLTPDPGFLFSPHGHVEVRSSIIDGIRGRKGIMVITGEVGAGKTTLINALLKDLSDEVKTAFISNPRLTFKQLFKALLSELKIPVAGGSGSSLQRKFHEYLKEKTAVDENVLIIIDEAQHLTSKVLEDLGRLYQQIPSGLNAPQTLLVGQLELEDRLNSGEVRQFKQRVAIQLQISLLNFQESREYIDHRLRVVGSSSSKVFTPEAVEAISEYAKGIPRVINVICDEALLSGYAVSAPIINGQMVREVIADIEMTIVPKEALGEGEIVASREIAAKEEPIGKKLVLAGEQVIPEIERFAEKESRFAEKDFRAEVEEEAIIQKEVIPAQEATEETVYPRLRQDGGTRRERPLFIKAGIPVLVLLALALVVSARVFWPENRMPPLKEKDRNLSLDQRGTEEVEEESIKIENGWTLSLITKRFYGATNPALIDLILEANPQITDLNRIQVGESIKIPKIREKLLLIAAADGIFKINLGTFMDRDQVRFFRNEPVLQRKEFEIVPRKVSPRETWYRVLAGPFATKEEALQSIQVQKQKGLLPFFPGVRKES